MYSIVEHNADNKHIVDHRGNHYWVRLDHELVGGQKIMINHLHRTQGPAYLSRNKISQIWVTHGLRHREDGPAVTIHYGDELPDAYEWFLYGTQFKNFETWLDNNQFLSKAKKNMMLLKYGSDEFNRDSWGLSVKR